MIRRTTIEIDELLLARAKQALGLPTTRATVEEALRIAAGQAESKKAVRTMRQRDYLATMLKHIDTDVLAGDEMWR